MTWVQIATLIVSIAATVAAGAGVIVLSVNGIRSRVATLQTQAAADREAFRGEMRRLSERQAHVEGALSIAAGQSR